MDSYSLCPVWQSLGDPVAAAARVMNSLQIQAQDSGEKNAGDVLCLEIVPRISSDLAILSPENFPITF